MDDDRRKLCQAGGLIVLSGVLPAGCAGGPEMFFHGGPASGVTLNDATQIPIPDHFAYVCRDQGGLYAMSAYCTHAHCVLQFNPPMGATPAGFVCNCHNSTFDFNGQNPTAPASVPVPHFKLVLDATGEMFIDPRAVVDPKTRTAG